MKYNRELYENYYELDGNGEIVKYHSNYHIDRFSFLPQNQNYSLLKLMKESVVNSLNSIENGHKYSLLEKDLLKEKFQNSGLVDVPYFMSQFVFELFQLRNKLDEKVNMQTMYIEGIYYLNDEIEKGKLNKYRE